MTVAFEAPRHMERILLVHERHTVHRSMTGRAGDPFGDVDAMIEIDILEEIVDPRPVNRLARAVGLAEGFQNFGVGPNLGMTAHAGLGGRDSGERRFFHSAVAIAAVDTQTADMVFMTERDGLFSNDILLVHVRAGGKLVENIDERRQNEQATENAGFGKVVCESVEYLRHFRLSCGVTVVCAGQLKRVFLQI